MSKKIEVALIFGGQSAEHQVSLVSASAIHGNLDKTRFDVRSIYITRQGLWRLVEAPTTDVKALARGQAFSFLPWRGGTPGPKLAADIYFPVLHGPYGEDGTIQGVLEMAGVPFVGAGVLGSALGMDKVAAKSVLRDLGLPVVSYCVIRETDWKANSERLLRRIRRTMSLPLYVKPSNLGSSIGITKVAKYGQVPAALAVAFRYDATALVEKGICGRELECSVLGNEAPEASLPGEIIPFREFYDYNDKYIDGKTTFVIPAELPRRTQAKVQELAIAAFKALGASGLARVDFFLERRTNRLYINEINTIPGFTEISMYPKLWAVSGLAFPRLLERLIELGFERHASRKACLERDR
jgi:D-alanine-D-alanine ligase